MPKGIRQAKPEINPISNLVLRTDISGAAKLPTILCLHLHLKKPTKETNKKTPQIKMDGMDVYLWSILNYPGNPF